MSSSRFGTCREEGRERSDGSDGSDGSDVSWVEEEATSWIFGNVTATTVTNIQ